jgi:2-octaprenyl-6-methoxyphenol hydroxylase
MAPSSSAAAPPGAEIRVELLVVGGGLAGMTLAIACAAAGLEVAVVDREDPARMLAEPFDGRSTAIAFGSRQVLAGIGLWPLIASEAEPILEIRVADGAAPLILHYDPRD